MNRYSKYAISAKGKARSKRYKDKNRMKIKAQNIALYVHKEPEPCSVDGCLLEAQRHHDDYSKPTEIIWLCDYHHQLQHLPPSVCLGKDCGKKAHAKRLCKKHYARIFRKRQGW